MRFHPDSSRKIYLDWMENIRPWCISRQLWWGHQLPVWYRDLETYVGDRPARGAGWTRDPDVLDTWFSSALWPFATLGWPDETPELSAFYPTDVLSTAREIINLWVARMIMMGIEFTGEVPFTDVNVHSVIQAPDGRRMSKSLGTGVDPIDLIEGGPRPPVFAQSDPGGQSADAGEFPAYGADALRWGLVAMSSGQDVRFSEDKVAQGQQLANKLWNASRLILMSIPGDQRARHRSGAHRGPLDPRRGCSACAPDGRAHRRVRPAPRGARSSTTSSTASCATGIWRSSSPGCARVIPRCSGPCCTCSPRRSRSRTRSSRSSPRRSGRSCRVPRGCWRRASSALSRWGRWTSMSRPR